MTSVGTTTKYLATCSESELQSCKTAARQALTGVMSKGVLEGAVETALENINTELKNLGIAEGQGTGSDTCLRRRQCSPT